MTARMYRYVCECVWIMVGVEDPHLFHYVDLTLYQGVITP